MKKFFQEKKTLVIAIAIAAGVVLAGVGVGIWALVNYLGSDKEPQREFITLEDGKEEEVAEGALFVPEEGEEAETMGEGGGTFPTEAIEQDDKDDKDNKDDKDDKDNKDNKDDKDDKDNKDDKDDKDDKDEQPGDGNDEDTDVKVDPTDGGTLY